MARHEARRSCSWQGLAGVRRDGTAGWGREVAGKGWAPGVLCGGGCGLVVVVVVVVVVAAAMFHGERRRAGRR